MDYERDLGGAIARFSANGRYRGKERIESFRFDPASQDRVTINSSGYWIVDLRAAVATPDDQYELAIFAKNVFDVRPLTSSLTLVDFGFAEYTYGTPRRIGVSVSARF
jgi:iron complex outermembrane receptor protein